MRFDRAVLCADVVNSLFFSVVLFVFFWGGAGVNKKLCMDFEVYLNFSLPVMFGR